MIRDFFLGFIKIHILYHASQEAIYGLEMIHELAHHGYDLSPGTLYPILHRLEEQGYMVSEKQVVEGKVRKYYTATLAGEEMLAKAYAQARELFREISHSGAEGS
ncbi:MAG: helix-turn-helix transcriptional regulator [Anaerolinea sp.]|nr:helix-turn-helix transcriptional regulator [Anaerolinea sp.]